MKKIMSCLAVSLLLMFGGVATAEENSLVFDSNTLTNFNSQLIKEKSDNILLESKTSQYSGNAYKEIQFPGNNQKIALYADGNGGNCDVIRSDDLTISTWFKWNNYGLPGRNQVIFSLHSGAGDQKEMLTVHFNRYGSVSLRIGNYDVDGNVLVNTVCGSKGGLAFVPGYAQPGGDSAITTYSGLDQYMNVSVTRSYNTTEKAYTYRLYMNGNPIELSYNGVFTSEIKIVMEEEPNDSLEKVLTFGKPANGENQYTYENRYVTYAHMNVFNEALNNSEIDALYKTQRKDLYGDLVFELGIDNYPTVSKPTNLITYEKLSVDKGSVSFKNDEGSKNLASEEFEYYQFDNSSLSGLAKISGNNISFEGWWNPKKNNNSEIRIFALSSKEENSNPTVQVKATADGSLIVTSSQNGEETTVFKSTGVITPLSMIDDLNSVWYHIALAREYNSTNNEFEYYLYCNGELLDNEVNPSSETVSNPIDESGYEIIIGDSNSSCCFKGVKLYTKTLSSNEIKSKYESSATFAPPEKVLSLGFNDGKILNTVNGNEFLSNANIYEIEHSDGNMYYAQISDGRNATYTIKNAMSDFNGISINVKPIDIAEGTNADILKIKDNDNQYLTFNVDDSGNLKLIVSENEIDAGTVTMNDWNKITAVIDKDASGANITVYVNGTKITQQQITDEIDWNAKVISVELASVSDTTMSVNALEIYKAYSSASSASADNFITLYPLNAAEIPFDFNLQVGQDGKIYMIPDVIDGISVSFMVKNSSGVEINVTEAEGIYSAAPEATGRYTVTMTGNGYTLKKNVDYVNAISFNALKTLNETNDNTVFEP